MLGVSGRRQQVSVQLEGNGQKLLLRARTDTGLFAPCVTPP